MRKVRETDESLNKGRDTFCLGEYVLERRFRFWGEILNMPQRKPHSFAAEWNSGKTCSPSSRGAVNCAAFRMTLMLLIAPFMAEEAAAQCVATADCASLGYTEASCPNGGIKCPFGNYWSCKAEATAPKANCEVGWILYSDKTCSSTENRDITKTPIGVVFYKNPNGGGMAIALNFIRTDFAFIPQKCVTIYDEDICKNKYYTSANLDIKPTLSNALTDFDNCKNTKDIKNMGFDIQEILNYTSPGTNIGDWCLPAAGTLSLIKENFATLQKNMKKLGNNNLIGDTGGGYTVYYYSSTIASFVPSVGNRQHDFGIWSMTASGGGNGPSIGLSPYTPRSGLDQYYLIPVLSF